MIKVEPLEFTPVPREKGERDGQPLYRLSVKISADWMEGFVELRFPEVVESSMGYHYIDHYRTTLAPISEPVPFPQWQTDEKTGAISYKCLLSEGLEFWAVAEPGDEEVKLGFGINNNTGQKLGFVQGNHCLNFESSPAFNQPYDLDKLFAVLDGEYKSLSHTTPTPEQVGRQPWLVLLTPKGKETHNGPKDTGTMWWLVDQTATENLMATESVDRRRLAGYTWDQWPDMLMTNGEYPCLHTGSGRGIDIENGTGLSWRGKVYLMENDPGRLVDLYRADQKAWKESGN